MDISLNASKTGVIVVDVQGDFTLIKKGSLAVPGTKQAYIDKVLTATKQFKIKGYKIFATQDYHPADHISFFTSHEKKAVYETIEIKGRTQILWPPHCVKETPNAGILINNNLFDAIVQKGMDPKYDSYSGFFDDNGAKTGLDDILRSHKITTLVVYGLATDYCVKATAMDAVKSGYEVILIKDLCKGVAEDTTRDALKEMESHGIKIIPAIYNII